MSSPGAIAFQIGPIVIRWYGILMATSIVVGLWIGYRQAKREGLPADDIVSVGQWAILAGLVGARLYEVIFNWDYYGRYPAKIVAVWEGGLAMHGGLIVGPLVGVWLARRWNVPILRGLDVTGPSMVLGQAIGRWGNFFNEEAFGTPTDLPWKLYIPPSNRPVEYAQSDFFHPTFLYESVWDLLVFIVLVRVFRDRVSRAPGALFLTYLGLYSVGRFFTEGLRTDALMAGSLRVAQLVSIVGIVAAIVGVPLLVRRSREA
jgi:prolipoprotein diacylglyceryl transferase